MVTSPQRRQRHFLGQDLFKIVPISCTPLALGDLNHTINRFDASEITTTAVILLHRGDTGGKGSITQWVHAEYMVGSETIRPSFTQWVRGGYFSKVPTKVPTG